MADQLIDTTDQQAVTVAQLQKVQDWLREPDHAEIFGTPEILEWIDRRPTHIIPSALGKLALSRLASVSSASAIKASAEVSLMYLQTGFIACPQCGEEVPTKDLDAAYELATVVQPAPSDTSPEPVPATNQAGEVEEQAPYTWRLDRSESESLFAALHGLTCSRDIHDIPDVMEAVTDIFRSAVGGDATRSRDLGEFAALAESINDSPALMSVYAAPEWDELDDNGQQWVCALVRETMARCRQDYAAALATQPATSQEGEAQKWRHKLWMVACHATGGGIPEIEGIDRSVNDICVQITQSRNAIYQAGKDAALATTPTPPTLSEDAVRKALERAQSKLGHVSIDAMNGDNLAVTLCTHFDDGEGDEDENGWTPAASDGCDATLKAIHEVYVAALAQVKAS